MFILCFNIGVSNLLPIAKMMENGNFKTLNYDIVFTCLFEKKYGFKMKFARLSKR